MLSQARTSCEATTTRGQRARFELVAVLYKEQLGRAIKRRREALGLTQRQLADLVNVEEAQTVSRWERGLNSPTDLEAVAAGLQTTASVILKELDPAGPRHGRPGAESQLDRLETKIDALLEHLKVVVVFDEMHDVSDPGAAFERETEPTAPPSSHSSDSSGEVARVHQAGSQEPPGPRRRRS